MLRAAVLAAALLLAASPGPGFSAGTQPLTFGAERYEIELATTAQQRQRGLMHRQMLGSRQGMLLVYPQSGDHRIWMKNMLIPLRVYWIDADYTVIGMQRLEPCMQETCPVYSENRDSRYVLELGDYDHPIAVGDRLALGGID